jgi:threonine dehydrogenase-like Zn-dependent dehydrogenase
MDTGRADATPLLTHTFSLNQIKEAHELCGKHAGGVIEAAIKP